MFNLQNLNVKVNTQVASRLPNTSNICFEGIDIDYLVKAFENIAFSNGSACTSATLEPMFYKLWDYQGKLFFLR